MVQTVIKKPTKSGSGFTLLELLVVVGILAALVALALPFYQDYVNQSKITAAQADLQTFKKALAMFDQLEPKSYGANPLEKKKFLPLVGRYLQDFRTSAQTTSPIDPWGSDYKLDEKTGAIWSSGPDGISQSDNSRAPVGDDLLSTWKPDFFVATARRIDSKTLEIVFSRKVFDPLPANQITAHEAGSTIIKISDTIFRVSFVNPLPTVSSNVSVAGAVAAQDGRLLSEAGAKPDGGLATQAAY